MSALTRNLSKSGNAVYWTLVQLRNCAKGITEDWNHVKLEYWNVEMKKRLHDCTIIPIFQFSSIPFLISFFRDPYLLGHSHQRRDGIGAHLIHDAGAVNLDGLLHGAELKRDLLIQHTGHD